MNEALSEINVVVFCQCVSLFSVLVIRSRMERDKLPKLSKSELERHPKSEINHLKLIPLPISYSMSLELISHVTLHFTICTNKMSYDQINSHNEL